MSVPPLARWIGFALLSICVLLISSWCALAIWFSCGLEQPARSLLAGAPLLLAVVTVVCFATSWLWLALAADMAAIAVIIVWWAAIEPSNDRDWAADTARTATGSINGEHLILSNVRNFAWRSDGDFDQRWEQRRYDLSRLTGVDLIMSYWAGEAIAHTIVSFGFDDGARLAFSIETRKQQDEVYSSIAGFFKQYELAVVAADERDVVRVRSNIRGEDVRIYRLKMTPANARILLREYVAFANELARRPRFYNTLTANCTTLVFDLVRVIHPGLPLDPRILLSGYLPDYVYDLGAVDTSVPFTNLRDLSKIHDKAAQADADSDFSARIREGVPAPG